MQRILAAMPATLLLPLLSLRRHVCMDAWRGHILPTNAQPLFDQVDMRYWQLAALCEQIDEICMKR